MHRSFLIDLFAQPDIASQAMTAECAESFLIKDGNHGHGSSGLTTPGQTKSK
jgi:hypothetical protein